MIATPESLLFYRIPAHAAALDRILGTEKIPADLTLEECRDFHLAKLTGLKIKTDYWCFLQDLWRATWGGIVSDLDPVRLGSPAWSEEEGRLDYAWRYHTLADVHRFNKDWMLWSGIAFPPSGRSELRLYCSLVDRNGDTHPDMPKVSLPEGWIFDRDEDWGERYLFAVKSPGGEHIDAAMIGRLKEAASTLLSAVRSVQPISGPSRER